jgi:hypothetical protein
MANTDNPAQSSDLWELVSCDTDTNRIVGRCTLTLNEIQQIDRAIEILSDVRKDHQLFQLVIWNCSELSSLADVWLSKERTGISARPDFTNLAADANRRLLNFLASAVMFTEHIRLSSMKRFGRKSDRFCLFEETLDELRQRDLAYVVVSSLRNYAVHEGFPISNISLKQKYRKHNEIDVPGEESSKVNKSSNQNTKVETIGRDAFMDQRLSLYVSRKNLLRNLRSKDKAVKERLKEYPEDIEINQFVSKFLLHLERLFCLATEQDSLTIDAARLIISWAEKAEGPGVPMLLRVESIGEDSATLQFRELLVEIALKVLWLNSKAEFRRSY